MRETSVIRNIDAVGRVVLPQELRRVLGLHKKIPLILRFHKETGEVMLSRKTYGCVFCGAENNLKSFCGFYICVSCQVTLAEIERDAPAE